ncbi:hypothetical protein KCP77_04445 [Salmonella enterica subsp. enterica]|nr:hypothetical protein KCP77_04445 [Salmonella enterica subsp. enterica]
MLTLSFSPRPGRRKKKSGAALPAVKIFLSACNARPRFHTTALTPSVTETSLNSSNECPTSFLSLSVWINSCYHQRTKGTGVLTGGSHRPRT